MYVTQPKPTPCKTCGSCPTCGKQASPPQPAIYPRSPYWIVVDQQTAFQQPKPFTVWS